MPYTNITAFSTILSEAPSHESDPHHRAINQEVLVVVIYNLVAVKAEKSYNVWV